MADSGDSKARIYREFCCQLDITAIAREGALEPGKHCGFVGSLGDSVIMESISVSSVEILRTMEGARSYYEV
jgi:hypothetical protein